MGKKITKKAAKKDLTGVNLAAIKRRVASLEARVRELEKIHDCSPLEVAVKNIKKGKWK